MLSLYLFDLLNSSPFCSESSSSWETSSPSPLSSCAEKFLSESEVHDSEILMDDLVFYTSKQDDTGLTDNVTVGHDIAEQNRCESTRGPVSCLDLQLHMNMRFRIMLEKKGLRAYDFFYCLWLMMVCCLTIFFLLKVYFFPYRLEMYFRHVFCDS